jgi:hypothetical protein
VLAALLLVGASASGSGRATAVHRFVAFEQGKLAAGLQASSSGRGYCWTASIADGRADAWRCFRGNLILDPCFSNGRSAKPYAVCPRAPWAKKVTLLRLTKPLPLAEGNKGGGGAEPWGIVSSNGQRCLALTGATDLIDGEPIRYGCEKGGVLVGSPNRSAALWTIYFAPKGSRRLTRVAISDAWS